MKHAVPLDALEKVLADLEAAKGPITASKRAPEPQGESRGVYLLEAARGAWKLAIHIDEAGRIVGFTIAESEPPLARSDIALSLPFHGRWTVVWGGERPESNHHLGSPSQRRAADLVVTDGNDKTFHGDGTRNEDYLAYGADIVAAADGVVTTVVDGVPDNAPGAMNPTFAVGNMVIVRHSPSLFSVYAHLQPGSARVKVGASVKRGAVLGRCGNSGNSSEPHLHFQLEDGPLFERSWGVEALFRDVDVTREGKLETLAEYTFLKGDKIEGHTSKR
jgi:murein DD-endopeptidase MepM/ murein hydrolase activator NlpD